MKKSIKKLEAKEIKQLSKVKGGDKSKNKTDFQEENDNIWG